MNRTAKSRLLRALKPHRGGRLPLVLLAATCAIAVTAAVSDATAAQPGLRFAQFGHWIANPSESTVFHVNGPGGAVDAKVPVKDIEPGSKVVQGETSGYVIGNRTLTEFDISTLQVQKTMTMPTGEAPVAVEAKGGPYLVFPQAGTISRLGGDDPQTIQAGAGLGRPVATPDGTLWLQRLDTNVICNLAPDADGVSCDDAAPAGHSGALTVVGKQPVFVDTDSNTLIPLGDGGGKSVKIGFDVPADAKIASADVGGRIAIIDPASNQLHLVDGSGRASSVDVTLPAGDYAAPAAGRNSVVLLDLTGNTLRTYDSKGDVQRVTQVPIEVGEPRLGRGDDRRVYVDGGEGKHVLVVGDDGSAKSVPLVGAGKADPSKAPVAPPPEKSDKPAVQTSGAPGPQSETSTSSPSSSSPNPTPTGTNPTGSAGNGSAGETETKTNPPKPPPKRTVQASPPGMPPGLEADPSGTSIRLTWDAAAPNGAAVTGYHVAWSGGSSDLPGGSRSTTLTGLTKGTTYRITVAAQNSAGRGTAATVSATVPNPPTRTVTVSRGPTTTYEPTCHPPECAFFHIVLSGFEPNTSYGIVPHSAKHPNFNGGASLKTDENGSLDSDGRFPFNGVGDTVWVTIDETGTESNRYVWPTE